MTLRLQLPCYLQMLTYYTYNKHVLYKLPDVLYRQQHCKQHKMHVLIQFQNSNWLTKKNKHAIRKSH